MVDVVDMAIRRRRMEGDMEDVGGERRRETRKEEKGDTLKSLISRVHESWPHRPRWPRRRVVAMAIPMLGRMYLMA